VRQSGRWHLTDIQRFLVAITVAVALFLASLAIGMGSGLLFGAALLLLVLIGLFVFLMGLRHGDRTSTSGEARVLSATPPVVGSIKSPCTMRLRVDISDGRSMDMRHRDPSVSVTKWPRVGAVLPVELDPRNKSLRILWDQVPANKVEPVSATAQTAQQAVPFYMDYAEVTGSTPPAYDPADADEGEYEATYDHGYDQPRRGLTRPDPAGEPHSPDDEPRAITATASTAPEPDDDPEVRARAAEYELPMRTIPQPRPAEPASRSGAGAAAGTGDADAAAMGAMLVVSDLQRSVAFYRDLVGLRLVDQASNTAVLSYGGGRVLLRQLADMSQVDRRVSHLHIQVSDVDSSYRDMVARGVEFVHAPRVISLGDRLDLWAATFRDPDGHDIALTQWRQRE
jgi:catechol 2,3-dioxygenase-like lactoylglutathione lyase family enzyme